MVSGDAVNTQNTPSKPMQFNVTAAASLNLQDYGDYSKNPTTEAWLPL